jgi:hypothetical protein
LAGDTTDRFTVPLSGYSEGANSAWRERLQLLEIRNKDQAAAASLVDVGYLSVTGLEADEYPSDRSRGVISGDAVYFINGTNVFSSLWDDPFNQVGPR